MMLNYVSNWVGISQLYLFFSNNYLDTQSGNVVETKTNQLRMFNVDRRSRSLK